MNLQELKKMLEQEGGKILVVENGKPIMVITPYEGGDSQEEPEPEPPNLERPLFREERSSPSKEESEELTIDDLPL